MRTLLCVLILSIGVLTATAAPPTDDDLALRVRVALSLSQSQAAACGECVFDEAEARAEAMHDHKPLVLLVGKCDGRGKVATAAGAVACIVRQYDGDAAARMIVLSPKAGEWYVHGKLPATATDDELRKVIGLATPEPPKAMPGALDWNIQAGAAVQDAKPAAHVKRYMQVCENGRCRTIEVNE